MRLLLLLALLVYSIIVFRAAHQAATLDEADAFNGFSTGNLDNSFYPSSGNHVLNSLLARYATQAFGVSQFTFRMPALLGAALYLLAVASIVTRVVNSGEAEASRTLKRALAAMGFAILTLNPFVLDYLVASRGYALALGMLACAVALGMKVIEDSSRALGYSAILSVCCGLAVAANFSFAFCIICTVAAFLLTLLLIRTPVKRWIVISAATTIPGVLTVMAVVGNTLRDFPRNQLYYGAETWSEMWTVMLDAVFPRQNLSVQFIDLEPVLTAAHQAGAYLILIPIAVALWTVIRMKSWPVRFVWIALALTLAAHGLAHSLQGLLLPLDRTSLFILFFLSVAVVHGVASAPGLYARRASTVVLLAALVVFGVAFRTNYFRIWYFGLDTDRGLEALARYAKDHHVDSAGCTWRYFGAYNFYRSATRTSTIPECASIDQDKPPPEAVYFFHSPGQDESIAKLTVIYKGPVSGLVVGIAPQSKK